VQAVHHDKLKKFFFSQLKCEIRAQSYGTSLCRGFTEAFILCVSIPSELCIMLCGLELQLLCSSDPLSTSPCTTCKAQQQTAVHGVLESMLGNQTMSHQAIYENPQTALHVSVQRYCTSGAAFVHPLN